MGLACFLSICFYVNKNGVAGMFIISCDKLQVIPPINLAKAKSLLTIRCPLFIIHLKSNTALSRVAEGKALRSPATCMNARC